jgi:hypothetical protein
MATKTATNTKKTTSTKKRTSTKKKVSAESIQMRAQEIYQDRIHNGHHGDALSDWLEAERQLSNNQK